MSTSDSDLSWAVLRQIVRDWAGDHVELRETRPLDGGSICTTLLLTTSHEPPAVLKITPHRVDRRYADEAHQLGLMRAAGVPTPEVYTLHIGSLDQPYSYLLMEYVQGVDLNAAKARCTQVQFDALQRQLAEVLLRLHATTGDRFARVSQDEVTGFDEWHACYRHIFDGIWREVQKAGLMSIKQRKTVARLHERLDRLLCCDGPPRLLHWDVWATNILAAPDGAGDWRLTALLDPNCKFGSPEAELAYLDLFHTATPAFFKTYQAERKLPAEYHQVRKPIYQLYSLLNHVRLFGPSYAKALCAAADKVAALV